MFGQNVFWGRPKRKHNSGVVFKDKEFDHQDERQQKSSLLGLTISSLKMPRSIEFLFQFCCAAGAIDEGVQFQVSCLFIPGMDYFQSMFQEPKI